MGSAYEWITQACGHICAQNPARSPFLGDIQFPLCWRCTGIYLALFVVLCGLACLRVRPSAKRFNLAMVATMVMAGVMLADVYGLQAVWPNNVTRAFTGVTLGASLGLWIHQCLVVLVAHRD